MQKRYSSRLLDSSALTLLELIVVLAIIAIIGAILLPNFVTTSDKARLKSDIQSAAVIESAISLYNAEQSASMSKTSIAEIVAELVAKGYLKDDKSKPQTAGAVWTYKSGKVLTDVSGCDVKVKTNAYKTLSDEEKACVEGGTPS